MRGKRVCHAEPQAIGADRRRERARLGAAAVGQLDRLRRVAVDAALDVVVGLAVAQQHELGGCRGRPGRLAAPGRPSRAPREEGVRVPAESRRCCASTRLHRCCPRAGGFQKARMARRSCCSHSLASWRSARMPAPARADVVDRAAPFRGTGAWVSLFTKEWSDPEAGCAVVRRARREDASTSRPVARTRPGRSPSPTRPARSSTRPTRPGSTSSRGTTRPSGSPISTSRACSRRPASRARPAGRSTASASTSRTRRSRSSRAGTSGCCR